MVVDSPEMIAYCDQKMFRHLDDSRVFLISKLRTSSDHAELWSYYLYKTVLEQLEKAGTLSPFTTYYVFANTENYVPYARMTWQDSSTVVEIDYLGGRYRIELKGEDPEYSFLREQMEKAVHMQEDSFYVPANEIEPTINRIVQIARSFNS
jgi:hypothetical protein